MATYTTNYNLEKPAQTDIYNVDVFNANADKIDAGLTDKAEKTMLAPVETTNSASRSYAKGEYFVYNNVLCCATTAIAAGGTIAIGTNCSTAPVGGELKSLRDALSPTKIIPTSGIMVSYTSQIVTIYFNGYSATNNSTFGLPSVCYPWQMVRCPFMDTTDSSVKYVLIDQDGNLFLRSTSGSILNSANITGTISYSPNA